LAGTFSNLTNDNLPTVSGSTTAIRFGRDDKRSRTVRIAAVSATGSWTLGPFSAASTTPGANGSPA